jgi:hypothetical protein
MYASLGTVFNNNFDLMFKIVSAFKNLLADRYNDIGTKNIQVLISCGKTVLEIFEDKMKNEKRVTHSGFGNVSLFNQK